MPLSLWYQNRPISEIPFKVKGSDQLVSVRSIDFFKLITPYIEPKFLRALQSNFKGLNFIEVEKLKKQGIELDFDFQNLRVLLSFPADMTIATENRVGGDSIPQWAQNALSPESFSGYLNYNIVDYVSHNEVSTQSFRTDFEANFNIKQFVLESDFNYIKDDERQWQRSDTRLVYDHLPTRTRAMIGDVAATSRGYLNYVALGGLQLNKNYQLSPYLITTPTSNQEFTLKENSKVDIFLNGQPIRTLFLNKGRHLIKDLPLGQGINDIKLVIEGVSGRQEEVFIPASSSAELLKNGLDEYSLSAGHSRTEIDGKRFYNNDEKDLIISGYYRRGLTDKLTSGFYTQGDSDQYLLGAEATLTSQFGFFAPDFAYSDVKGEHKGLAAKLSYWRQDYKGPSFTMRHFKFALSYLSPHFARYGTLEPSRSDYMTVEASYNQSLTRTWRFNIGFNYSFETDPAKKDPMGASLLIGKNWTNTIYSNLQLSRRIDSVGERTDDVYLFLTFLIPSKRQSFNATYGHESEERSFSWQYHSPKNINKLDLRANARTIEKEETYEGEADFTHQRFQLQSLYKVYDNTNNEKAHNARIQLGSAIAFAGSGFSISRPIQDSFALVKTRDVLRGQTINLNHNNDFTAGSTSPIGSAILPDLRPYRFQKLYLDDSDLEYGMVLGKNEYVLAPGYKTGHLLEVGDDPVATIIGYLFDENGKALTLEVGELIAKDPQVPAFTIFTNRKGRFVVEGLRAGLYTLKLDNHPDHLTVEIKKNQIGLVKLGKLKVRRKIQ